MEEDDPLFLETLALANKWVPVFVFESFFVYFSVLMMKECDEVFEALKEIISSQDAEEAQKTQEGSDATLKVGYGIFALASRISKI